MLICFGDLMQIRPVKQRWVFEAPAMGGEDLVTAHELDPLWEKLEVVNLEENHRQGEDKGYADMLLRARVGGGGGAGALALTVSCSLPRGDVGHALAV